MKRKLFFISSLLLVTALPLVGRAGTPFGEDNITLGAILSENIKQTVDIGATLDYVRSLTAEASDIARFTRDAVKVANNVRMVASDPAEFGLYATRSYAALFPEARTILAHTIDMRLALGELRDPAFYEHYDPYAYVRAFDALQNVEKGAVEVAARSLDYWNVHEPHDRALEFIGLQHKAAVESLQEVAEILNHSGFSPQRAQLHAMKTSAISATAMTEAAATLEKLLAQQELIFMNHGNVSDAYSSQLKAMQYEARQVQIDWRLQPVKSSRE